MPGGGKSATQLNAGIQRNSTESTSTTTRGKVPTCLFCHALVKIDGASSHHSDDCRSRGVYIREMENPARSAEFNKRHVEFLKLQRDSMVGVSRSSHSKSPEQNSARSATVNNEACQICCFAGRESGHDFRQCPYFQGAVTAQTQNSDLQQLKCEAIKHNPTIRSELSTAQTASQRLSTTDLIRPSGNILYYKEKGRFYVFDGPIESSKIKSAPEHECDSKTVSMMAIVNNNDPWPSISENLESSPQWQEQMSSEESTLFKALCFVTSAFRNKIDEQTLLWRTNQQVPPELERELDFFCTSEFFLSAQLTTRLNISSGDLDDVVDDQLKKGLDDTYSAPYASYIATPHVAETGSKQPEIDENFLQHVTPVSGSEKFKPGQERVQQATKSNSRSRSSCSIDTKGKGNPGCVQTFAEKSKVSFSQWCTFQFAMLSSRRKLREMNKRYFSLSISSVEEGMYKIEIEFERLALLSKTIISDRQEQNSKRKQT